MRHLRPEPEDPQEHQLHQERLQEQHQDHIMAAVCTSLPRRGAARGLNVRKGAEDGGLAGAHNRGSLRGTRDRALEHGTRGLPLAGWHPHPRQVAL